MSSKCEHKYELSDGKTMCDAPGMPDYLEYALCVEKHPGTYRPETHFPCKEDEE